MATGGPDLLQRIEGLELKHDQAIEALESKYKQAVESIEQRYKEWSKELHTGVTEHLTWSLNKTKEQSESMEKLIGELTGDVNADPNTQQQGIGSSAAPVHELAARFKEIQAHITMLNMATAHVCQTEIPKNNEALREVQNQLSDMRTETTDSIRQCLEANEDMADQVQALRERASAIEHKAGEQAYEFNELIDAHRVELERLDEEGFDAQEQIEEYYTDNETMHDFMRQADKRFKQVQESCSVYNPKVQELNDRIRAIEVAMKMPTYSQAVARLLRMQLSQSLPTGPPGVDDTDNSDASSTEL